jgi:hypothetical protein
LIAGLILVSFFHPPPTAQIVSFLQPHHLLAKLLPYLDNTGSSVHHHKNPEAENPLPDPSQERLSNGSTRSASPLLAVSLLSSSLIRAAHL